MCIRDRSLVDQFEDVRRKHRNTFTNQEDIIRDEESELLKQKNILSKGGTEHPMILYKRFRGRAPDPEALLRRAGLT